MVQQMNLVLVTAVFFFNFLKKYFFKGGGKFVVKYTIPHDTEALIFVKYGDGQIPGSPFPVRPAHENGSGKEYNNRI